MFGASTCPRCMTDVSQTRMNSFPVVCDHCGYVLSGKNTETEQKLERTFIWSICGFSAFLVIAFLHVSAWGPYSMEILSLKAGQYMGGGNVASWDRVGVICLELKKYECVEEMYARMATVDPSQYARLGKFQMSQRKFANAAESYRQFFVRGGGDLEANYQYARALSETGRIDEAAKHFDYVLAAKPDVLQVTVVQNYVKYLVQANQLARAKQVIEKVRRRGTSVSQFMDTELNDIKQKLGTST